MLVMFSDVPESEFAVMATSQFSSLQVLFHGLERRQGNLQFFLSEPGEPAILSNYKASLHYI